jgi:hypothetical protein
MCAQKVEILDRLLIGFVYGSETWFQILRFGTSDATRGEPFL